MSKHPPPSRWYAVHARAIVFTLLTVCLLATAAPRALAVTYVFTPIATSDDFSELGVPNINNDGVVTFTGTPLGGVAGIFYGDGTAAPTTVVDLNDGYDFLGLPSINTPSVTGVAPQIAFTATPSSGPLSGLYRSEADGSITTLAATNDGVFGNVTALNNNGYALTYGLIAGAVTPTPTNTASFDGHSLILANGDTVTAVAGFGDDDFVGGFFGFDLNEVNAAVFTGVELSDTSLRLHKTTLDGLGGVNRVSVDNTGAREIAIATNSFDTVLYRNQNTDDLGAVIAGVKVPVGNVSPADGEIDINKDNLSAYMFDDDIGWVLKTAPNNTVVAPFDIIADNTQVQAVDFRRGGLNDKGQFAVYLNVTAEDDDDPDNDVPNFGVYRVTPQTSGMYVLIKDILFRDGNGDNLIEINDAVIDGYRINGVVKVVEEEGRHELIFTEATVVNEDATDPLQIEVGYEFGPLPPGFEQMIEMELAGLLETDDEAETLLELRAMLDGQDLPAVTVRGEKDFAIEQTTALDTQTVHYHELGLTLEVRPTVSTLVLPDSASVSLVTGNLVPEPGSVVLLVLMGVGACVRRGRR